MSRESLVFTTGLVVLLITFSGIPPDWKKYIFITSGALLMLVGYSLRRSAFLRSIDIGNGERRGDTFMESMGNQLVEEEKE